MKATSEMLNPYERVVQALEQGGTIPAIARSAQVSPTFAQNVVEHFQRIGRAGEASSLCSSGLGLCSPHHPEFWYRNLDKTRFIFLLFFSFPFCYLPIAPHREPVRVRITLINKSKNQIHYVIIGIVRQPIERTKNAKFLWRFSFCVQHIFCFSMAVSSGMTVRRMVM